MTEPLKLAVVGHTNVGKTSLLRTFDMAGGAGPMAVSYTHLTLPTN